MKKIIFVLGLILAAVLLSFQAFAASPTVYITPDPAYDNDDLTCNIQGSTNPNLYYFEWYKNSGLFSQGWGSNFISNSYTSSGDSWKCKAYIPNPNPGQPPIYIGEDSVTIQQIVNNPPYVPNNPNPSNGASNIQTSISLSWNGGDPDGDSVSYDVYFGTSSNPNLVSMSQISTSYNPGTLGYNTRYYWKIVSKDSHGSVSEGSVWSFTTASAPNNPPTINSIQITPQNPSENNDLTCSVSVSDQDGNLASIQFDWYINGNFKTSNTVFVSGYSVSASNVLSSSYTNAGDTVKCEVKVYDAQNSYDSDYVTVQVGAGNHPPQVLNVHITPSSPTTVSDLTCEYDYSDQDGDPESGTQFSWFKNGVDQSINSKILSNTYTSKNQQWYCKVKPSDGKVFGNEVASTTVTIQNSPPQFSGVITDQTWSENTDRQINLNNYFSDSDGDQLTFTNTNLNYITVTYSSGVVNLHPQTNWYGTENVKFTASDGSATKDSNWVVLTVTHIYTNQPPVAVLSVNPTTAQVSQNVKFDGSGSYDNDGSVIQYYFDFGDGYSSGWVSSSYVYHSYANTGTYYAKLKVKDNGYLVSDWSTAVSVTVVQQQINNPPYTPGSPYPSDNSINTPINADLSWSGGDPDGDSVSYDVYFGTSSNPPYVGTVYSASYDLPALNYNTQYYWKIVAKDSKGAVTNGPLWRFKTVNVQVNNPPVMSGIPDQSVNVGQTINPVDLYPYAYDSEDSDDSLSFSIESQSNTNVIYCYVTSDRYVNCNSAANSGYSDVTVKVTDTGGLSDTDLFRINVGQVVNQPPVAVLSVNPTTAQVSQNVKFDGSGSYDNDGSVIQYYFDFGDGYSSGWVSSSYVYHSYANTGTYYAKLKVKDNGYLVSDWSTAVSVTVSAQSQNHAPNMDNIDIIPLNPDADDDLTCVVSVSDQDGDLDHVVFKWYRNNQLIRTRTNNIYGNSDSTSDLLEPSYTESGDTIKCEATVSDKQNLMDSDSKTVTIAVDQNPPSIDYIQITPQNPDERDDLTCSVDLSDQNGDLDYVQFKWYVDGSLRRTSTKRVSGSHASVDDFLGSSYTESGDDVKCEARAYDRKGLSDYDYETVYVESEGGDQYPVAILDVSLTNPSVNQDVGFDGSDSYDSGGYVTQYYFDYGDGYSSGWTSDSEVQHSYSSNGVYYAKLKVKDNENHVSGWSNSRTINVGGGGYCGVNVYNLQVVDNNKINAEIRNTGYQTETINYYVYVNNIQVYSGYLTLGSNNYGSIQYNYNFGSGSYNIKIKAYADCGSSDEETITYNTQGICGASVYSFDYWTQVTEGNPAWIKVKAKNTGNQRSLITISLYVDNVVKTQYTDWVDGNAYLEKVFEPNLPKGNHDIRVYVYSQCGGQSDNRYASIFVKERAKEEGPPQQPEQPAEEPKEPQYDVDIYPKSLDVVACSGTSVTVHIKSSIKQTFNISVTGIPDNWVYYPKKVDVEGSKKTYIYIAPKEEGVYNFTVSVKTEGKNFESSIDLYVAPYKKEEAHGIDFTTGFIVFLSGNWISGIAFIFIMFFFAVVYFGWKRLKYEDFDYEEI